MSAEHLKTSARTASGPDTGESAPGARRIVSVRDLTISTGHGRTRRALVDGVSFTIETGRCLGIVGESGSGKSLTSRSLIGLNDKRLESAELSLFGTDMRRASERRWRALRGARIGYVLQDALGSLDPLKRVEGETAETLRAHGIRGRRELAARVDEALVSVGFPDPRVRKRQRPYQLSGGLRQRALIASAIIGGPSLLIADEPTTALDATTQQGILELLAEIKRQGTALLLITHDLPVVSQLADDILVLKDGAVQEYGPAWRVLAAPRSEHTKALLAAIPSLDSRGTRLAAAAADPAELRDPVDAVAAVDAPAAATMPTVGDSASLGPAPGTRAVATESVPAPDATAGQAAAVEPILRADGLAKRFRLPDGRSVTALNGVSLTIARSEIVGVVGESGSGKSTLASAVLGLIELDAGTVELFGCPWNPARESARTAARPRVQLISQDPLGSFDPRFSVAQLLGEAIGVGEQSGGVLRAAWPSARTPLGTKAARRARARDLLALVGLDQQLLDQLPRHLSGGQRQRVAIARALACGPELLICDEAVSALDVSVQAQVLDLLAELKDKLGLTILFISHNIGVIGHLCDRVLVMRGGQVVEEGDAAAVLSGPQADYTKTLLDSVVSIRFSEQLVD